MSKPEQPPRELVSFLESLSEPHILCDRNYRILAANEAYRVKWVGQREVVGRTCYEVSHRYSVPCDQAGHPLRVHRQLPRTRPVGQGRHHPADPAGIGPVA